MGFLSRIFARHEAPEQDSVVEEYWNARLGNPAGGRFAEASATTHTARYIPEIKPRKFWQLWPGSARNQVSDGCLELALLRSSLFAWTDALVYRHSDFILEAAVEFAQPEKDCACGVLFRFQDEGNFYSLMVSLNGHFRVDVVFNGKPRPLIAWTEYNLSEDRTVRIALAMRGTALIIMLNDAWAGETTDATFRQGFIAFAAQSYSETGRFLLKSCEVESRPLIVESTFLQWRYHMEASPTARLNLAKTFLAMGEHLSAAIQVQKIEKKAELGENDLFFKAEVDIRLGLFDEAKKALEQCLALNPARSEALEEMANLLYLKGSFLELRDFIGASLPDYTKSARLLTLHGHALFALGDYTGAAHDYGDAAGLESDQALFHLNHARALDQGGAREDAVKAYARAARLLSREGAQDDLAVAIARLSIIAPTSLELREIQARRLYEQGKFKEAEAAIDTLLKDGTTDSSIRYLAGMLASQKGYHEEAYRFFKSAFDLEPDSALYAFRCAERLFLMGKNCNKILAKALKLHPDNGWLHNLEGQVRARGQAWAEAQSAFETAMRLLPEESAPALNLADLELTLGNPDRAIFILGRFSDNAACLNLKGNAYIKKAEAAREHRSAPQTHHPTDTPAASDSMEDERRALLDLANREYRAAIALDGSNLEYRTNLIASLLAQENWSEAEAELRRTAPYGADARVLLLTGNLAEAYGEFSRGQAAYLSGLARAPDDAHLLAALARNHLRMRNAGEAAKIARRLCALASEEGTTMGKKLLDEIEDWTTDSLECSVCFRTWRVPRDIPTQSIRSIHGMPPDESPAGKCPSCGKIYCIGCRKQDLRNKRFTCPACDVDLKLSDPRLLFLIESFLKAVPSAGADGAVGAGTVGGADAAAKDK